MNAAEINPGATAIVVPANEGKVLEAFGNTLHVKLSGEQTQNSLAVGLIITPPNVGPPPHVHSQEDEMFLIIEGQFQFLANGEWTETMGAGTVVYLPRGSVHTFKNVGDTDARHWVVTTPNGFEQFFTKCADVFAQAGPPDMGKILAISTEHGIEYVPPLTAPQPTDA